MLLDQLDQPSRSDGKEVEMKTHYYWFKWDETDIHQNSTLRGA
jgi:hypothetical protein